MKYKKDLNCEVLFVFSVKILSVNALTISLVICRQKGYEYFIMDLQEFFRENRKAAVAFSGGVDSAYLLYAAQACGADVCAYYGKTPFQPEFEYADAVKLCKKLNISMKIMEYDILSERVIADNSENRCYYCKKTLFSLLKKQAQKDGYRLLIDGTNASDRADDRPGMKALAELSVRSPLRECGLTKEKIRELSKVAGLFTWDKPAYACLATRIPIHTRITEDLLKRIENAETALMSMGFFDFRVRVWHGCARLQMKEDQFVKAASERGRILNQIKPYFETVLLDMEVR